MDKELQEILDKLTLDGISTQLNCPISSSVSEAIFSLLSVRKELKHPDSTKKDIIDEALRVGLKVLVHSTELYIKDLER